MTNRRTWQGALVVVTLLVLAGSSAQALTLENPSLVGLLSQAEVIVVGTIDSKTDGINEGGLGYTEISLNVEESIRGNVSGTYAFRQFGLLNPRTVADGTLVMMPAPDFMPKYAEGDRVLLFLGPKAEDTGLQSPVGLGQGRFLLGPARIENDFLNEALFTDVSIDGGLATDNDKRILETQVGAVNDQDFLSLVRRAVQGGWVQTCLMWNTSVGKTCENGQPVSPVKPVRPITTTRPTTSGPTRTIQSGGGAN